MSLKAQSQQKLNAMAVSAERFNGVTPPMLEGERKFSSWKPGVQWHTPPYAAVLSRMLRVGSMPWGVCWVRPPEPDHVAEECGLQLADNKIRGEGSMVLWPQGTCHSDGL